MDARAIPLRMSAPDDMDIDDDAPPHQPPPPGGPSPPPPPPPPADEGAGAPQGSPPHRYARDLRADLDAMIAATKAKGGLDEARKKLSKHMRANPELMDRLRRLVASSPLLEGADLSSDRSRKQLAVQLHNSFSAEIEDQASRILWAALTEARSPIAAAIDRAAHERYCTQLLEEHMEARRVERAAWEAQRRLEEAQARQQTEQWGSPPAGGRG